MSKSYKLKTAFSHNYRAFTEPTRRENEVYGHPNATLSPSVFEKKRLSRLNRRLTARAIRNVLFGDPETVTFPATPKTVNWNIW